MKLIFTSMKQDSLFHLYETETKKLQTIPITIKLNHYRSFGISWDQNHLYVAQPEAIIASNCSGKQIKILEKLAFGIHQILVRDGYLWIVSPLINAIKRYHLANQTLDYFSLIDYKFYTKRPDQEDLHHFNSVFIQSNFAYVVAHNHNEPSFILKFSYPEWNFITQYPNLGRKIHNVLACENEFFYLDSLGETRAIVSSSGKRIVVAEQMFLRGLAATENIFITSCFPEATRHSRSKGDAQLIFVDRKTNEISYQTIKNIGSISDIRILDEFDLAHGNQPIPHFFQAIQ